MVDGGSGFSLGLLLGLGFRVVALAMVYENTTKSIDGLYFLAFEGWLVCHSPLTHEHEQRCARVRARTRL